MRANEKRLSRLEGGQRIAFTLLDRKGRMTVAAEVDGGRIERHPGDECGEVFWASVEAAEEASGAVHVRVLREHWEGI